MRYIEAPKPYLLGFPDVPLFLAGGITNCPNWQKEVVELLSKDYDLLHSNMVILNPRRQNFPIHDPNASYEQIKWEWDKFRKAKLILFWFSRGSLNPIVLFEYGKWMTSKSKTIFVGIDPKYERKRDIEIQTELERLDITIVYNLRDLVNQIIESCYPYKKKEVD